ncbi:hypothetical protein D3C72_1540490 [compost metagenome]
MFGVVVEHFVDGMAGGVAVHHDAGTRCATEQLVQRHIGGLALDVPQRHVYGRDGGHGDRPAAPVGAFIEELPYVFDLMGVPADQLRTDMIFQIGRHR